VTALYATWPASIEYANALALGADVAPMLLDCEAERLAKARAQFDSDCRLAGPATAVDRKFGRAGALRRTPGLLRRSRGGRSA
jgi:hypothetical protein